MQTLCSKFPAPRSCAFGTRAPRHMRAMFALLFLLAVLLPPLGVVQMAHARDMAPLPQTTAPRQEARATIPPALVFDLDTGKVLLAHDAGKPWHPASLTKLMTAWLVMWAVDVGRLSFDTEVTISKAVVNGVQRGAAKYGVKPGQRMSIRRMLTFLMVRSDADMALALAEAVAGSERAFVAMMNRAARQLGMNGTRFANCHGMHHPAQVTTARDMAVLARDIYRRFLRRHPDWWRFFSLRTVEKRIIDRKTKKPITVRLKNRNHLLFMMPEATGMKTGFICASGFNLLATAKRGRTRLGAVVFGRRSAYNRASVARVLLEEGFRRHGQDGANGGKSLTLARLRNSGGPTTDMTTPICRKPSLPLVRPQELAGWAVLLGPVTSNLRAVALAEAELLAANLADNARVRYGVGGLTGKVLRASGLLEEWQHVVKKRKRRPAPFAALIWNLNEPQALNICLRARAHGVHCTVQSPEELRALAKLWPAPKAKKHKGPKKKQAQKKSNIRPRPVAQHPSGRKTYRLH